MMKSGIIEQDLYELQSVANPQLSPGGKEVLFVKTHIDKEKKDYVSNLFYIGLEDRIIRQWTYGNWRTHTPRWSPDGSKVAFVSNHSGESQIYVLYKTGGEAKQITFCKNGAENPVWSPDGSRLAFSAVLGKGETIQNRADHKKKDEKKEAKPVEVEKMKYKANGKDLLDSGQFKQIGIVTIESGEMEQITEGERDYELDSWSPDGKYIAYLADPAADQDFSFTLDLFLYNAETKHSRAVTSGTGVFYQSSWSPDSRYLSFLGEEDEFKNATHTKVWLYDRKKQTLKCLTSDLDVPAGDFVAADFQQGASLPGAEWAADSESFYFIATARGGTAAYYGNVNGEIHPVMLEKQYIYGLSLNKETHQAVAAISTPVMPGELFLVDLQNGTKQQLTNVNGDFLQDRTLADVESFTFTGNDDYTIEGWMMRPAGFEEGKKYPLILEVHGGPHAMYGYAYFHEFQVLAARGFAVMFMNPRGSLGYGQKFVNAVRGDYGGKDYQDIMDAVDYVLEHYDFIDAEKLGVTGGSYGGFMTNWIVGHTNRFKAAVTQRSISNWISFYGVSDIGYYFTEWQILADLGEPEKLWKHSPLAYADKIETPLLILHGEEDHRCPIEQAEQLFIALKRQHKETKFIRFPQSNHELSRSGKPELRISRLAYIKNWFIQYLK